MIEPSARGTRTRSAPLKAPTRKLMNFGALLTKKYGAMLGKFSRRNLTGFAVLADEAAWFIEILLRKSVLRRTLNSGCGSSRSGPTSVRSLATFGFVRGAGSRCGGGRRVLMARSSCSAGGRLVMAFPHLFPQSL